MRGERERERERERQLTEYRIEENHIMGIIPSQERSHKRTFY